MIIDFHTHIFPDPIAPGTIATLEQRAEVTANTDGKLSGLLSSMHDAGITYSVVLPVATKPTQFQHLNHFAAQVNEHPQLISFGGIHPDTPDISDKLMQLKELGFKGIKLHPDYQKVHINDPRNLELIRQAVDLDLIVVIHAGVDVGLPDEVHCPPAESLDLLNYIAQHATHPEQAKIVLAHMGGWMQWDKVEELLVGKMVYFDLAYCFDSMPIDTMLSIINNHGADRILFASDSPWGNQKQYVTQFNDLPLNPEEKEAILYKNAASLLGIPLD